MQVPAKLLPALLKLQKQRLDVAILEPDTEERDEAQALLALAAETLGARADHLNAVARRDPADPANPKISNDTVSAPSAPLEASLMLILPNSVLFWPEWQQPGAWASLLRVSFGSSMIHIVSR